MRRFVVGIACAATVANAAVPVSDVGPHGRSIPAPQKGRERSGGDEHRRRLRLQDLESILHTSLGKQLDSSSSSREIAFEAILDAEWASLTSEAGQEDELSGMGHSGRQPSPFLVCTDRHPDVIRAVEDVTHRTRTQIAYSKGDTSCLLAGLRLGEVDAVREASGVRFVEPLPHPAKLSHTLHATLEPEGALGGEHPSDETRQSQQHVVREVRFGRGAGLPDEIEVILTPGTWGRGVVDSWKQHIGSFETTAALWDHHLRKRFLWTKWAADGRDADEGHGPARTQQARGDERGVGIPGHRSPIDAHGLTATAALWEQAADRSSAAGVCDLGRLGAGNEDERRVGKGGPAGDSREESGSVVGRGTTGTKSGAAHDRLVLRGAGSLGKTSKDNAHCLLTVLAYLSTRANVARIDDVPPVVPLNIEAAWITQSGRETMYPLWNQGIDGRTEIIAVADSGLDMNSCFFRGDGAEDNIACSTYSNPVHDLTKRKVVQYVGYVDCDDIENGHGTHVAGSAAGSLSDTSPGEHLGDGTGFRAKLTMFDFGNELGNLVTPSDLESQMLDPPYAIGARVSSNSWGAVRTTYTSLDRQVDNAAFWKRDLAIVVAAGNCGDRISECEYQGDAIYGPGSILSPAMAKNVVTVGASEASPSSAGVADNVDEVAYFSSQGPTSDDGRIKPDVVAPGYHLFSAAANPDDQSCEIGPMAGTSMATPIVAGSAAMIRQYFVQGWYPSGMPTPSDMLNPSNALVKAVLVASGTAMAAYDGSTGTTALGEPPDGFQGFGRVLLDSVLNLYGSVELFVQDATDIGHGESHTYAVGAGGSNSLTYEGNMKVAMVWMEPAALSGSVSPVYNDLDVLVIASDGVSETTFYPNNLGSKDFNNTVEMVSVPNADAYAWINVTVTGASVTTSTLPYYALVVTGGIATTYTPTASTDRSWFVRWKMEVEGVPVVQAATVAFESGLAEAISSEIGGYVLANSTVLARIDRASEGEANDDAASTAVTFEMSVDSEADGYAVLTYVVAVAEGSSSDAAQGLAGALNAALESRTTEDCMCVATSGGAYDCSACQDGDEFATIQAIITSQGDYDLLSTGDFGSAPISVFAHSKGDDDDAFWSQVPGGGSIRGILRTDTYTILMAVVAAIVVFTGVSSCCVLRCSKSASVALPRDRTLCASSLEVGSKQGTPRGATQSLVANTWGSPGARPSGRAGGDPATSTPGVTPAPVRPPRSES